MFTRSVNLKVFDNVISAYHWPGPRNVLRPRLPVQPRHGEEKVMFTGVAAANQPLAHWSWVIPPTRGTLALGRSFLPPSRLKSPPTLWQFASCQSGSRQSPFGFFTGSTMVISLNFGP